MKRLIAFCLVLSVGIAHAQKAELADSMAQSRFQEAEKQSYRHMMHGNDRQDAVASSNNFHINFYRCEWQIDPAVRFINGKVTAVFTMIATGDDIIFDLSDVLTVDSITYHGAAMSFLKTGNDGLQLQFPATLQGGQKDSIAIYYHGVPRNNPSSQSFYTSSHNGVPVIWTSSEPYGAKEWWPCKNGLTDKADSIEIILSSPSAFSGTANGVLIDENIAGGYKTVHFKHRYPIASYLVAIAVTNYVTNVDSVQINSKILPVMLNTYPESVSDFLYATYTAKQCLPKFSELLGEYPFIKERYTQTQCGIGGGMENQTNTFIGGTWGQTVAHELWHQWFGDMVTCGSWQHIWLNEGFANYSQFIYVQNFNTALIQAHLQYYLNLIVSQPGGSVFVTDTTDFNRIFDNRLTYAKGGYIVHMLRGMLGDSIFFKGLRQYLNDPLLKNKFAVTADLERNLEQVSGKNLQSFFTKWIYGEGYANYNCSWTQNNNNWAQVQINQTTSNPSVAFYEMPVQLEFKNSSRDTIVTVNNLQNGEQFWINLGFAADTMLVDPNFWILAKDRMVRKLPAKSVLINDIKIYPNPAPDQLNIQLLNPSTSKIDIQLYNMAGQMLYKTQKAIAGYDELMTIPVSRFAKGSYIIKISCNNTIETKKVLIK